MVNRRGDVREMDNDERRQYEHMAKGKKEVEQTRYSSTGKATQGQMVKGRGRTTPSLASQPAAVTPAKTSTPEQGTEQRKRQAPADSISPIQAKVRAAVDEAQMAKSPDMVDRPSRTDPRFWDLGSTKMMTARIVPAQPHLDGSELGPKDIAHISSHFVEKTEVIDVEFAKELDIRDIGITCGVIRICAKKSDSRHIDWWRKFTSSVPPRVKNGTGYKFMAPGEEEEVVYKVYLKDPRFANPDKAEVERIILNNWRRSPISGAKFRLRLGQYNSASGILPVWIYFQKTQATLMVLEEMKYTVQYGLERYLLIRATRSQPTIADGDDDQEMTDETVQVTKKPVQKISSAKDIDLNNPETVASLLDVSENEELGKVMPKRRHTMASASQVKEAIAKALASRMVEGGTQSELDKVAGELYGVVKNTMEAIANDQGEDFTEDWEHNHEQDMEKVVEGTKEMTTRSEGDMDTRPSPPENPLLGPTEAADALMPAYVTAAATASSADPPTSMETDEGVEGDPPEEVDEQL